MKKYFNLSKDRFFDLCSHSERPTQLKAAWGKYFHGLSGLFFSLAVQLCATTVHAGETESDTRLTAVYGKSEVVSQEKVWSHRLEHFVNHASGSAFAWLEHLSDYHDYEESYLELQGRPSVSYLSGRDLSVGPIADFYFVYTLEAGKYREYDFNNHLYGVGIDLRIPELDYVETNFYYRNNSDGDSDKTMETIYGRVFELGSQVIILHGLMEWSSAESDRAASFRFNPQLRLDVGRWLGLGPRKLEAGLEYSYWHNKFGLKDIPELKTDESVLGFLATFYL